MKKLIAIFFIVVCINASARTFYISNSGSDSYTSTQAQDSATPWRTIAKVNSFFTSFLPDDNIYFKRGGTYNDTVLIVGRSGTSGHNITIGAYSSGAKPIITALYTIPSWTETATGSHIWKSAVLPNDVNDLYILKINGGSPQGIGRYPDASASDSGYLKFETSTGTFISTDNYKGSITDNELPVSSTTNWSHATLVLKTRRWLFDILPNVTHSSRTISWSSGSSFSPNNLYGYFITDDIKTLTVAGEWYMNDTTNRVYLYSLSNPSTTVQVAIRNNLISLSGKDYITITGLEIAGCNGHGITLTSGSDHVNINACSIHDVGNAGVNVNNSDYPDIESDSLNYCLGNGIITDGCDFVYIASNSITNTSTLRGLGQSGPSNGCAIQILHTSPTGAKSQALFNYISEVGYCGIRSKNNDGIEQDSIIIDDNTITRYCKNIDDGGGVYVYAGYTKGVRNKGSEIMRNLITYAIGAPEGTPVTAGMTNEQLAAGIYTDVGSKDWKIQDNRVAFAKRAGFYINNGCQRLNVTGNIFYECGQAGIEINTRSADTSKNNTFSNNQIVASLQYGSSHYEMICNSEYVAGLPAAGTFSANYYWSGNTYQNRFIYGGTSQIAFSTWKSLSGSDATTKFDTVSTSRLRFDANTSLIDSLVDLGAYSWLTPSGIRYLLSVTLASNDAVALKRDTAVVLHRGSNPLPVVSLTAPTAGTVYSSPATIGLTATATISSGTITKVDFYNGSTLIGSDATSPYTFSYTSVPTGGYSFNAKAISSYGDTVSSASVSATVKLTNNPPTVSITSPADGSVFTLGTTITYKAIASDVDGDLYKIRLRINGADSAVFLAAALPYQFTWTPTIAGTYKLEAMAKDSASDTTLSAPVYVTFQNVLPLRATSSQTNILCNGGTGSITISATGGTPPYTGTGTFTKAAGAWTFPVGDAASGHDTIHITLTEPTALSVSAVLDSAISNYLGSSTVTATATGGTIDYLYKIDSGPLANIYQASNVFSVTAGSYVITAQDANGCTSSTSISVTQPTAPTDLWIHHGHSNKIVN